MLIILITTALLFTSIIYHVLNDSHKIGEDQKIKHGSYLLELILPVIIGYLINGYEIYTIPLILSIYIYQWFLIDISLNSIRNLDPQYYSKSKNAAFTDKILKYSIFKPFLTKFILFTINILFFCLKFI